MMVALRSDLLLPNCRLPHASAGIGRRYKYYMRTPRIRLAAYPQKETTGNPRTVVDFGSISVSICLHCLTSQE